jgi:hypothetical protein
VNIFISFKTKSIINIFVFNWALFWIIVQQENIVIRSFCIIWVFISCAFLFMQRFSKILWKKSQEKVIKTHKTIAHKKLQKVKKKEK